MSTRGPRNRPRKPRSYRVRVSALRASLIGSRSCRTQQLLLSFNHSHTRGHPESTHVAAPRACCQLLLARELSAGRSFGSPPSSRFTSICLSYLTSLLYARQPLRRCPTGPQLKKAPPPPLPPPARPPCVLHSSPTMPSKKLIAHVTSVLAVLPPAHYYEPMAHRRNTGRLTVLRRLYAHPHPHRRTRSQDEFEYDEIMDIKGNEVLVSWKPTWVKIGSVNNLDKAPWAISKPENLGACAIVMRCFDFAVALLLLFAHALRLSQTTCR